MNSLERKKYSPLLLITKFLLSYLFFSSCPNHFGKKITDKYTLFENHYSYTSNSKEINILREKFILDLSKNNVLNLIDRDLLVNVGLDVEGKIIGYKPSKIGMPNYWNSEITKKIILKNNLFSMSYKGDQAINFKVSSLLS